MKRLMKELASLSTSPIPGITLLDDQSDMSVIQAIIEGPIDTPYEEGRFRVTLKLGNDYPTSPPKGAPCVRVEFDRLVFRAARAARSLLKRRVCARARAATGGALVAARRRQATL